MTRKLALPLACALLLLGCGPKKTNLRAPDAILEAQSASLSELVTLINERYAGLESLTVSSFRVQFTGGSIEKGYLKEYPTAKGHLVARPPDAIYVNILNPVTSSAVVTMAASNEEFQIWVPRENKYLMGSTKLKVDNDDPMYSIRPDHLIDAMLIEPIPTSDPHARVFLEEEQTARNKFYVINVVEADASGGGFCLRRKVWIERSRLQLARQSYYDCGALASTVEYGEIVEVDGRLVGREVAIERYQEHYKLSFRLEEGKIRLNRELREAAFEIPQPPGAEIVRVRNEAPQ